MQYKIRDKEFLTEDSKRLSLECKWLKSQKDIFWIIIASLSVTGSGMSVLVSTRATHSPPLTTHALTLSSQ